MAWVEPVTDWLPSSRFTYDDMNRICGNLNYLVGSSKFKVNWGENDILTVSDWDAVKTLANNLGRAYNIAFRSITNDMTASNIDELETLIANLKQPLDLVHAQRAARVYAGDAGLYAGVDAYTQGGDV